MPSYSSYSVACNGSTLEILTLVLNSTGNNTVTMETADGDALFTTMHDYHVTLRDLLVAIVMLVLGSWIILLNCLLIHTLVKCHAQLEVTDMFIHSLAVTDTAVGVLILYNSAYNVINFQNRYECLVRFGLIHTMLMNSTGFISLLTINRYIKITRPFQYTNIFKKWRIVLFSASIWCISLGVGLTPLAGWNKEYVPTKLDESHTACRYFGIMQPGYILLNVSLYWIPLILMIVMYSHVAKITCHHSRMITAQEQVMSGKVVKIFESRSWRLTKTILIVIGVYFFCWLPTGVYFMVQVSGSIDYLNYTKQGNILTYTTAVGFLNSLMNPIIYATKIPCVKQRFTKVFCCKQQRRQSLHTVVFSTENMISLGRRNKTALDLKHI
ncbi:adenosine receptor A3-like [Mercenaria mercenaria]|uniref:adenosine receptor A3-like n=1 Tax=Mercenaria mercenaria TaxID=6596 RepID=UPI00234F82D4|nr:adenosine receptor A3-like [Mercenaria mercenaria]